MPTTTPLYEQRRPHRPQSLVGAFSTKRLNEHNCLPHKHIHHKRLVPMWIKKVKNMVCGYLDLYSQPCPPALGGCPFAAWHIAKLVRQGGRAPRGDRCPRVRSPGRQLPLSMLHS